MSGLSTIAALARGGSGGLGSISKSTLVITHPGVTFTWAWLGLEYYTDTSLCSRSPRTSRWERP